MPDAAELLEAPDPLVGTLIRESLLVCEPRESLRDAARKMVERGASSTVVPLDRGQLGILTDRDLRAKVVAEGLSLETPVCQVLTTPIVTAREDQLSSEALLQMIEHGIRHLPVLAATGEVVGVLTDIDLLAAESRAPFLLRRTIANARGAPELREAALQLNPAVVGLHEGGLAPTHNSAVISIICEALMRRMIELTLEAKGPPPTEFAWLSLGSHGRREAVPSSDVDSGMTWDGGDASTATYMHDVAAQVDGLLAAAEFKADPRGVTASGSVMTYPATEWRTTIDRWFEEPTEATLMATSILLDGRSIYGPDEAFGVFAAIRSARNRDRMLRLLLRVALVHRPPTSLFKDVVVEHSGAHRGSLNVKHGGLIPIIGIARYAGLVAGCESTSTLTRLQAAGADGVLEEASTETLVEAYRLLVRLRIDHQVRQLQAGDEPDNYLDPKRLNPLTRRFLGEAFRLVASIQKKLATELEWLT